MRIEIPGKPLSQNKLERMHWAVRAKLKKSLAWEIRAQAVSIPKEPGRMKLRIELYLPTRRFDKDNAVGGSKVLVDALRSAGLIKNDSPRWLEFEGLDQFIDHENPRTVIFIEPSSITQGGAQ